MSALKEAAAQWRLTLQERLGKLSSNESLLPDTYLRLWQKFCSIRKRLAAQLKYAQGNSQDLQDENISATNSGFGQLWNHTVLCIRRIVLYSALLYYFNLGQVKSKSFFHRRYSTSRRVAIYNTRPVNVVDES